MKMTAGHTDAGRRTPDAGRRPRQTRFYVQRPERLVRLKLRLFKEVHGCLRTPECAQRRQKPLAAYPPRPRCCGDNFRSLLRLGSWHVTGRGSEASVSS